MNPFHPFFILAGGMTAFMVFISLVVLLGSVFWIVEIVDAIRRQFYNDIVKIAWILVIFFTHFIGALAYYIAGKSMGKLPDQTYNSF